MSSFDRRAILVSTLALAGCGFTPIYGPGGSAETLRGRISYDDPSDREGFLLIRQLERRLGLPEAARYRMSASIALKNEGAGITLDQEITRYRLLGRVRFSLTDIASGDVVTSGEVNSFTSYSATGSTVATVAATDDARERLMVILADQVVARLLATAPEWLE